VWISALVLALGVVGAGTGEATHSGADAPPLVVAQLAPIGNVEHATGTLVIRRSDGRIDQLRAKGTAPLFPGDECRTERASKALVRMADGKPGAYTIVERIRVGAKPAGLAASPEGGRIYVSLQGTDQLAVIDTGTGRVIGQVAVGLKPVGVAASR
jgi:YVTN family beta-propeller protein